MTLIFLAFFNLALTLGGTFALSAAPETPDETKQLPGTIAPDLLGFSARPIGAPSSFVPDFPSCDPESKLFKELPPGSPTAQFCSKWDPYFQFRSQNCCGKIRFPGKSVKGKKGRIVHRSGKGTSRNYCKDMTSDQIKYLEAFNPQTLEDPSKSEKIENVLAQILNERGTRGDQAYCTEHDGFLAFGRPLVSTSRNRIQVKSPEKCLYFGTDSMIGMIEWLGLQIGKKYKESGYEGVKLTVGNISAPRGGPLYNSKGRRRHLSHASGQDADIGFLIVKNGEGSPNQFPRSMDPAVNWWFLQQIFQNPHACVKAIFLDRHHIHRISKIAKKDSNWPIYRRFIRHMPGHKNHFHIRIGKGPGRPGCTVDAKPEQEFEVEGYAD